MAAPYTPGSPYGGNFRNSGPQPENSIMSTPRTGTQEMLPETNDPLLNDPAPRWNEEKTEAFDEDEKKPLARRPAFWIALLAALAIVVVAVVVPVYFVVIKPKNDSSASTAGNSAHNNDPSGDDSATGPDTKPGSRNAVTGGDGTEVTKEDGTKFTYKNSFGGYWYYDPENPFDNSARPNSWTPPLNQSWDYEKDRMFGVNLGGLFVLEPFISPALFEANPGTKDEWTLNIALAQQGKLQEVMENHYDTFITEEDIAEIAGAGLNWVRLPVPFWAIELWSDVGVDASGAKRGEPYLEKVAWKYILRMFGWCRKYGLRINLDLHTIPGSQNGYNHSGKGGSINFLHGVMGVANAQRALDYIRTFTEFISQPEYKDLIPMFSIMNEPRANDIGMDALTSFYLEAHKMIRDITGVGEGKGPYIVLHEGFRGTSAWADFMPNADRLAIDTHPYFAFGGPNREPINITAEGASDPAMMGGQWPQSACNRWGSGMNNSRGAFGVTLAGEFSNGYNDCGLFLVGPGNPSRYGPDCGYWENYQGWSPATKNGLLNFAMASMDALGDWYFWTWKIGNSLETNTVRAPLWSYQLGLKEGWMPKDPRKASGTCASLNAPGTPWDGTFQPWQTGGAGAGNIAPALTQQFPWPPAAISNAPDVGSLPQYTSTATPITLAPPTQTAAKAQGGDGWFNKADNAPAVGPIAGCEYPFAWDANDVALPAAGCRPATSR